MKRGAFTWVAAWLAPAALLAAAPCACAETWVVISGQTGQDMVEVDVDSAARSGDVARLWTQMIYAQPKTDHATGKAYSTRVQELHMDCRSRRVQSGAAFLRDASGAPVAQSADRSVRRRADPRRPRPVLGGPLARIGDGGDLDCASAVAPPAVGTSGGAQAATEPADSEPMPVGVGTAWATSKGYLVTASHVVQDGDLYLVYRDGQVIGQAKLVADDPASDLAILKLKPRRPGVLTALPLAARGAPLGESVFALGYPEPQELGQEVKLTTGVVSGANPDDARMLQVTSPLQPGNSGGPIVGWDGAVVGVADKAQTRFENAPAQNVNYAVKTAYVRAMLEDLPDLGGYAYVKPAASHEALIAEARRAVFMLIVAK